MSLGQCPSDSDDYDSVGRLAKASASTEPLAEVCRDTILSVLPSYVYLPYATVTAAQGKDVIVGLSRSRGNWGNSPDQFCRPAPQWGCRRGAVRQLGYRMPDPLTWTALTGFVPIDGSATDPIDDDGQPTPAQYRRLREGVERFLITDINNPAGSARAQSAIPVMWDVWGQSFSDKEDPYNTGLHTLRAYNHLPGGANVLWMDGHAEYVPAGAKHPVKNGPSGTYGQNFGAWVRYTAYGTDTEMG